MPDPNDPEAAPSRAARAAVARLPVDEVKRLGHAFCDRAVRVHLPLALRAAGQDRAATLLEDLPAIDDDRGVPQAITALLAGAQGGQAVPAEATDALQVLHALDVAVLTGDRPAADEALLSLMALARRMSGGAQPGSASSPSGAPIGLRALDLDEGKRMLEEIEAVLDAPPAHRRG